MNRLRIPVVDHRRCIGGKNEVSGKPQPACIQCDLRSYAPASPDTEWVEVPEDTATCPHRRYSSMGALEAEA